MRNIWIVAKLSLTENSRKQIFHVLCLFLLAMIAFSTLVLLYSKTSSAKIMKDLCFTSMLFSGALFAISLGAAGLPNDIESKLAHPVLARPISRTQYLIGKFIGAYITVIIGMLILAIVYAVLISCCKTETASKTIDGAFFLASLFIILEVGALTAAATAISTVATPAITVALSGMAAIAGNIKMGFLGNMLESDMNPFIKLIYRLFYHLLPNLEAFNFKTAAVHQNDVPAAYMTQVAIYGICYICFAIFIGCMLFERREI